MQNRKPRRKKEKQPETYTCDYCQEVKQGMPRAAIINGYPFPQFCSSEHMELYEQNERNK